MLLVTKILHVTLAAAWFGHRLLMPRDLRNTLHDRVAMGDLIQRMARAERLGMISGLGTVLTGLYLIVLTTGFADAPLRIYLGLAAVIAMFAVGALVAQPAWRNVTRSIENGELTGAYTNARSFTRALTLESLLWVGALAAMLT